MPRRPTAYLLSFCLLVLSPTGPRAAAEETRTLLPTGATLDPAGRSFDVGNMPLAMALSPEGDRVVLSLCGWREQGLQVVDAETGRVTETVPQPAAFFGLAFSPDGKTLFASGGNEDVVYRYAWRERRAELVGAIALAPKKPKQGGTRFPAGVALSRDGRRLYVAENLSDTLAVVDVATGRVAQRLAVGPYPYAVAVAPDGRVYVSAWGGDAVVVFAARAGGALAAGRRIAVGRHPSALLVDRSGSRLFVASASTDRVAVVDTKAGRVVATLSDAPPAGPGEGSTPDALALSADGSRLFVAEADNNAVAVFELSARTAGARTGAAADRLIGRIPVGWYPTALVATGGSLLVLNGKGRGTRPNPQEIQPNVRPPRPHDYTLGQLDGTITALPAAVDAAELARLTERVARANRWDRAREGAATYPPFKHVVYIIKENRTYDQVLADLPDGDGDPSLLFFPRAVSPNHHALAERFGLFDRFFVNAEVSSQGHVWSTSAYVTDYTEKTTPSAYSDRRGGDDHGGVDVPAGGYLWDAAVRKRLTLRNYGEFAEPVGGGQANEPVRYRATRYGLAPYTCPDYPSFDTAIPDQRRLAAWLGEFREYVRRGDLPALEILHLPSDHTAGGYPGRPTPRAYMADNDLALGRIVEAVSTSPFWKDTVLFVLEDDAQDGPDHVDSHRSVLLVISAYNRAGTIHRFVNTTDVFATVEEILGLDALSQFDYYGHPLRDVFGDAPDLSPYTALVPEQRLDEMNPTRGENARASRRLDLDRVDAADEDQFNRVLWRAIKGDGVPYPGTKRMSTLDVTRAR